MNISVLFRRVRKLMAQKCRDRKNYQALAHLDRHQLKDIGLYREQGMVRPLNPENFQRVEPMPKEGGDPARSEVEPMRYCPSCGTPLA